MSMSTAGTVKSLPKMRDLCNESCSVWIEARTLEKQGKQAEAAAKDKASRAKQKEAEVREAECMIRIEPAMFGMAAFVRFSNYHHGHTFDSDG